MDGQTCRRFKRIAIMVFENLLSKIMQTKRTSPLAIYFVSKGR